MGFSCSRRWRYFSLLMMTSSFEVSRPRGDAAADRSTLLQTGNTRRFKPPDANDADDIQRGELRAIHIGFQITAPLPPPLLCIDPALTLH